MKRINLLSLLLVAVIVPCSWGQTYYNARNGQSSALAQALIGTWEPGESVSYSGYASTSARLTFYSNGTYALTTTTIVTMGDYSNDGEETATGVWKLQGTQLYLYNQSTGELTSAQLRMTQRDAFYADDELWVRQSASAANSSEHAPQQLCKTFVGEYVSHDHAIQVQNEVQRQGFEAWIAYHGCLTCTPDTRTYVVFAMLPCE